MRHRLPATFVSYLTADFFWGSEVSRRAGTHRGDAGALGTVFGVAGGKPDSRRLAGVGKADALTAPRRLCETGPEQRLAGVLCTTALEDKTGLKHRRPQSHSNRSANVSIQWSILWFQH